MKSLTLSLLVAFGLTLGAANAFAETPASPFNVAAAAQSALREAQQHEANALQYQATARAETQAANDSMKIAIADDQHGFPYEAGEQRKLAKKHQDAAAAALAAATREQTMAAQCRARAAALTPTVTAPFVPSAQAAVKIQMPRR